MQKGSDHTRFAKHAISTLAEDDCEIESKKQMGDLGKSVALKRLLDIALMAIFVISLIALFLSHEDPFARDFVCTHTGFCSVMSNAKAWNKIFYDLAVGSLITLLFYVLVVRIPDCQRRQRLKKSFERHYKVFRKDCIQIMLLVADSSYSAGLPETLMEHDKFRNYFKENVTPDRSRWHEFLNNIDEYHLNELLTRMEIFRDEISFVLNNTDIPKDEPFEFLKSLSATIYLMKNVTLGYDKVKPLADFLWNMFAGWDWTTGYRKEDIVKKMIDAI